MLFQVSDSQLTRILKRRLAIVVYIFSYDWFPYMLPVATDHEMIFSVPKPCVKISHQTCYPQSLLSKVLELKSNSIQNFFWDRVGEGLEPVLFLLNGGVEEF